MWAELAFRMEATHHIFHRVLKEFNLKCNMQPTTWRCWSLTTIKTIPMTSIQTLAPWTRRLTPLPFVKKEDQLGSSFSVWPNQITSTRGHITAPTRTWRQQVQANLRRCIRYKGSRRSRSMPVKAMQFMNMRRKTRSSFIMGCMLATICLENGWQINR